MHGTTCAGLAVRRALGELRVDGCRPAALSASGGFRRRRTPPGTDTGAPDRLASPNPRSGSPKSGTRAADGYSISSTALSPAAPVGTGAPTCGLRLQWFCEYVFAQHGVIPRDTRSQLASVTRSTQLRSNRGIWCSSQLPHRVRRTSGFRWVAISSSTHRAAAEVRVENLSAPYWTSRFVGARRLN